MAKQRTVCKFITVAENLCQELKDANLPVAELVKILNAIRRRLHKVSPFRMEPVDCVQWVPSLSVEANDYNPNTVAPPEMKLLEISILEDGYTQPIVTFKEEGRREVVDGFHRNRVGRECLQIRRRIKGYLPVVTINECRMDRGDRIAATIRHNRARGKHGVDAMSEIVIELKRRNWTDEKIARELGMEQDEILRLCQISGLAELFNDQQFSQAWDIEGSLTENDFEELTDTVGAYDDEEETAAFRTVNTSDKGRVFYTYDKWECYKAGFYATVKDGMSREQCEEAMAALLADAVRFKKAVNGVISKWKNSCAHYLTNSAMNRIAWLGQAATCYALGIPACFRGGFNLLTQKQKDIADDIAQNALNRWLKKNGMPVVTIEQAAPDRQTDIY